MTGHYVPDRRSGCGYLVLALHVDAVGDPEAFRRRVDDLVTTTKRVPLAADATEICYPGEIEERNETRGRATGAEEIAARARRRGGEAGRLRRRQLEITLVIAAQCGLAATLSWALAHEVLDRPAPIFAPARPSPRSSPPSGSAPDVPLYCCSALVWACHRHR